MLPVFMGGQKSSVLELRVSSSLPSDERMAHLVHELNAPVSLIAGGLENLDHCLASIRTYILATTGHRETDPDLERIYRQQHVESELVAVSDLLAICREGVGRIGYLSDRFGASARGTEAVSPRRAVDPAAILRRAVTFAKAARGVSATIEMDFEETPALSGDFESLSAAFINLVTNALDAVADRQAPLIRLSLRYDSVPELIEVRVHDNGAGIDAVSRGRIFESFYTTKRRGFGLGLSIVREALEQHGGSIEVTSHEGVGTEFIVRFPLRDKGEGRIGSTGVMA